MTQQKPRDVNEPSRRRLLKGIGALGGALAISGGCPMAQAAKAESSPGTLAPDARQEKQPFYGPHQAGILTPQQASMMLVAFDVLAAEALGHDFSPQQTRLEHTYSTTLLGVCFVDGLTFNKPIRRLSNFWQMHLTFGNIWKTKQFYKLHYIGF